MKLVMTLFITLAAISAFAQTGNNSNGPGGVPSSTGSRTSTKQSSNGMSGSSGSPETPSTTVEAAAKKEAQNGKSKSGPTKKDTVHDSNKATHTTPDAHHGDKK